MLTARIYSALTSADGRAGSCGWPSCRESCGGECISKQIDSESGISGDFDGFAEKKSPLRSGFELESPTKPAPRFKGTHTVARSTPPFTRIALRSWRSPAASTDKSPCWPLHPSARIVAATTWDERCGKTPSQVSPTFASRLPPACSKIRHALGVGLRQHGSRDHLQLVRGTGSRFESVEVGRHIRAAGLERALAQTTVILERSSFGLGHVIFKPSMA